MQRGRITLASTKVPQLGINLKHKSEEVRLFSTFFQSIFPFNIHWENVEFSLRVRFLVKETIFSILKIFEIKTRIEKKQNIVVEAITLKLNFNIYYIYDKTKL